MNNLLMLHTEQEAEMNEAELKELSTRCLYASTNGFQVARAEHYAALLAEMGAEMPEGEITASDLVAMVAAVLDGAKPKKKASKPEAPKASAKAKTEAKSAPKEEKAKAAAKEEKPADALETFDDLAVVKDAPTPEEH